ncbi:MAG: tRNA preQ1(34) S-adenosylmethionine ribosyltransferase-isomerase QueA [Candidatus Gracilibacteria bacterium]
MKLTDFDYSLPEGFIAQDPSSPRDSAKLMVFDAESGVVEHKIFRDIVEYLNEGDVLVLNRSKVLKARIVFDFAGGACEIFLLRQVDGGSEGKTYNCLVKPGRKFQKGSRISVNNDLIIEVLDVKVDGVRVIKFITEKDVEDFGVAPFPPYIKRSRSSLEEYQTVYAREKGSVASPTAGLHFTNELLNEVARKGVSIEKILLHVGLGTFAPVRVENVVDHVMHSEFFQLTDDIAERLNAAKREKRRIVAVGTTSVRVLETCFKDGEFKPWEHCSGETNIFIYPGYKWKAVDALVTNFHLPKSTLIMLVASFLEHKGVKDGAKKILELYEIAKKENYRFYSFGDAMIII